MVHLRRGDFDPRTADVDRVLHTHRAEYGGKEHQPVVVADTLEAAVERQRALQFAEAAIERNRRPVDIGDGGGMNNLIGKDDLRLDRPPAGIGDGGDQPPRTLNIAAVSAADFGDDLTGQHG